MGLDGTAAHLIWGLVLIAAGGGLGVTLVEEYEAAHEATEARSAWDAARLAADIQVIGVVYNAGTSTVVVQLKNVGDVPLDPMKTSFVFSGAAKSVTTSETGGVAGSRVWPPGTHANITVSSKWSPKRLAATDPYGHTVLWINTEPPVCTEAVISPSPVAVQATKTVQLTVTVYDQFGDVCSGSTPHWTETVNGASVNVNTGLFTAGKDIHCGTVTVTRQGGGGPSNSTTACVERLDVYVNWIKMYKGNTEQYSFRENENPKTKMELRAAVDGLPAPSAIDVWMVTKKPDGSVAANKTDATDGSGVAETQYNIPNSGPEGAWTVEVTGASATWIRYRGDLNAETVQNFTVT